MKKNKKLTRTGIKKLKSKIKQIQDYLGPRLDYLSDNWPKSLQDKWLMEYLDLLKIEYYNRIELNNKNKKKQKRKKKVNNHG